MFSRLSITWEQKDLFKLQNQFNIYLNCEIVLSTAVSRLLTSVHLQLSVQPAPFISSLFFLGGSLSCLLPGPACTDSLLGNLSKRMLFISVYTGCYTSSQNLTPHVSVQCTAGTMATHRHSTMHLDFVMTAHLPVTATVTTVPTVPTHLNTPNSQRLKMCW
jgi:hypothetical protein